MNGYLPARIIQAVGLLLLVGAFVFWAITGKESVLLVSSAMSLILLGSYKNAMDALTRRETPPSSVEKKRVE